MIVGVTGSIGSGKSTVCKILAATLGAELISSDELCRRELLPGKAGLVAVERRWKRRFLSGSGELDRPALRIAALEEPEVLSELEEILHPLVHQQILAAISRQKSTDCLVIEVPLLYEVGWEGDYDIVVVVKIGIEQILERVIRRDGRNEADILKIIDKQLPLAEKVRRADYCVDNSGIFCSTVEQVFWLGQAIRKTGISPDN